jgi:capsid protein
MLLKDSTVFPIQVLLQKIVADKIETCWHDYQVEEDYQGNTTCLHCEELISEWNSET